MKNITLTVGTKGVVTIETKTDAIQKTFVFNAKDIKSLTFDKYANSMEFDQLGVNLKSGQTLRISDTGVATTGDIDILYSEVLKLMQ